MFARGALVLALSTAALCGVARSQCEHREIDKWTALVPTASAQFGGSVAIEGDWAAVGAVNGTGALYLFHCSTGTWTCTQSFTGAAAGDNFGNALALEGTVLVVGARSVDYSTTNPNTGAVYIYERTGNSWGLATILTASDQLSSTSPYFGESVAIEGDTIVVGANFVDNTCGGAGQECGAAYVFVRSGTSWSGVSNETVKLEASTPTDNAQLGSDVAIDGGVVLVGAEHGTLQDTGAAFIYERPLNSWGASGSTMTESCCLVAANGQPGDSFGGSVALQGSRVVVAAGRGSDASLNSYPRTGLVYIVDRPSTGWPQTMAVNATLAPPSLRPFDYFGHQVSLQNDRLVVGAPLHAPFGLSNLNQAGLAYVFEFNGSTWNELHWLVASDRAAVDTFGFSVATDGDTILVGAIVADVAGQTDAGAAYLYDLSQCDVEMYCTCPTGVCGNADPAAGCANSTGSGALLFASNGTTSVAADDLELTANSLPPSKSGLLFMGFGTVHAPLGDGFRCVGPGPLFRWPVRTSGPTGAIAELGIAGHSQTFGGPGPIQAGDTRYFQVWYRDPQGRCSHLTNVSSALKVTFEP